MDMRRILMVLTLILMVGCAGHPSAPDAATPPTPAPVATAPPVTAAPPDIAPAPGRASALFPAGDEQLSFALDEQQQVAEYLLRDGDRFVAVQDGAVYATWFLREDGLWRLDPKGGGALLRYLPAALADGLVWHQKSGDADVWFSLHRGITPLGTDITRAEGWFLTIVNRDERLELTFAQGIGPAMAKSENWKVRTDSYTKRAFKVAPGGPSADQRQALLAKGITTPQPPAPVVAATPAEFEAAARAALLAARPDVKALDLDGDGKREYLRGPLDVWTSESIDIFRSDAQLATTLKPWPDPPVHRVRPVTFDGDKRIWFIHEQQVGADKHSWISLTTPLGAELWGCALKATYTEGNRIEMAKDGLITVWWDLGDPARHRWIREYRIDPANPDRIVLKRLSSRFEPAETELRRPTELREVLQAAFTAQWYGLADELPRYFASAEAAAALASVKPALYHHGTVEIGTLTFEDLNQYPAGTKLPKIEPGPVRPDGTATFLARLGSYETSIFTWGTVTFTPDGLIQKLVIEGTSEIM